MFSRTTSVSCANMPPARKPLESAGPYQWRCTRMPAEITMPQLSDTMTEGTVVKWHKKEGDKVKSGDELVDVETDKATMPFEASESGTLAHVAVKAGQKVPVGALIAILATSKENAADVKKGVAGRSGAASKASGARGDGT